MNPPPLILIIEDSELLRMAIRGTLENARFRVKDASDGEAGLAMALREHPDLIMLDLLMPVMDGMTMFKLLRKDKWGAHVPVIILTAIKDDKIASWLKDEQLDFLLKENWMIDEVVTHVKKALDLIK
jgi:DNA-binding response OmpR family regulator